MREHIYFFSDMCHVGDVQQQQKLCWCDTVKWTATRPFGVVMITFFFFFLFQSLTEIWSGFPLRSKLNFGLIPAGSGEKCIHQNNRFWYQFWYQDWLILSAVYYPYWRIRHSGLTVCNVLIDRFLSLQIFRFHNIWIVWLADFCTLQIDKFHNWQTNWFLNLWIFKFDNLQIVWLADSSIYRFCANWQILQAQIEIFSIDILFDCEILLRFYSPHIGRFLNLWTMWLQNLQVTDFIIYGLTDPSILKNWQIPQFTDYWNCIFSHLWIARSLNL